MTETPPTFGSPERPKTQTFQCWVYDEVNDVSTAETFTAWTDPGAGVILAFMRSPDKNRQIRAAGKLVYDAVVDNDGLQIDYEPPALDSEEKPDPRIADISTWSSRRRFGYYADSTRYRIESEALLQIADWIVRGAFGGRPTRKPTDSSRGQTPTGPGSEATSSSEA